MIPRDELDLQLQTARRLLTSADWTIWATFLRKQRRGYLQQKVNQSVKDGNLVQAQIYQALLDDCNKQLELFGGWIKETESALEKEK